MIALVMLAVTVLIAIWLSYKGYEWNRIREILIMIHFLLSLLAGALSYFFLAIEEAILFFVLGILFLLVYMVIENER